MEKLLKHLCAHWSTSEGAGPFALRKKTSQRFVSTCAHPKVKLDTACNPQFTPYFEPARDEDRRRAPAQMDPLYKGIFTLVTRGRFFFLTSASKFYTEPNGGIFDVSPKTTARQPM